MWYETNVTETDCLKIGSRLCLIIPANEILRKNTLFKSNMELTKHAVWHFLIDLQISLICKITKQTLHSERPHDKQVMLSAASGCELLLPQSIISQHTLSWQHVIIIYCDCITKSLYVQIQGVQGVVTDFTCLNFQYLCFWKPISATKK